MFFNSDDWSCHAQCFHLEQERTKYNRVHFVGDFSIRFFQTLVDSSIELSKDYAIVLNKYYLRLLLQAMTSYQTNKQVCISIGQSEISELNVENERFSNQVLEVKELAANELVQLFNKIPIDIFKLKAKS